MWGGRFSASPDAVMAEINASIDFDRKLAAQDIAGSQAHVAMLAHQGIVEAADAEAIANGLAQVKGEIEAGTFSFKRALEDIHMNVESRLSEIVGPAAGRLHTARSRNDQVALDFRLWVRDTIDAILVQIAGLQRATYGGVIIDGKHVDAPGADRAVVFQTPCLLPWLTARQNVALAMQHLPGQLRARDARYHQQGDAQAAQGRPVLDNLAHQVGVEGGT